MSFFFLTSSSSGLCFNTVCVFLEKAVLEVVGDLKVLVQRHTGMREYKPLHYKAEDYTSGTEWAGTIMGLEILSWLVKM